MSPSAKSPSPVTSAHPGGADAIASAGYVPSVARTRTPPTVTVAPDGARTIPSGRPRSSDALRINAGRDASTATR